MNMLLKNYLILEQRHLFFDKKICKQISNFSISIWRIILINFKKNPAILNTFSPLIFIIQREKNKNC